MDARDKAHETHCGCTLINCEFVIGWNAREQEDDTLLFLTDK